MLSASAHNSFLLAVVLVGCNLDPSGKNACEQQSDCISGFSCVGGQCLRDAVWGCLSSSTPAPTDISRLVHLTVFDEGSDLPVENVTVRTCLRSDQACTNPTTTTTSDTAGQATLTIADEYVEIVADGYRSTLLMSVNSFEVTTSGVVPLEVHFDLRSDPGFEELAFSTGVSRDPSHGDIEVLVRDCAYESAGGTQVLLEGGDTSTVQRYLVNDLPSLTATVTDIDSGGTLFFNAPPGVLSVVGRLADNERFVGGALAALVREGWLTHVGIVPTSVAIDDAKGD